MFHWRRLTQTAVVTQVIASLLVIGIIPFAISAIPSLRRSPAFTIMTREQVSTEQVKATSEDVKNGLAKSVGETIAKEHRTEPVPLYFEDGVARQNPADPSSPKEGIGRFNIEIYLVRLFGVNVADFTPPMIMSVRFLVDSFLPIFILIVVSWMTRPGDPGRLARFYVKLKTPVGATPSADSAAVCESYADPTRFDHAKLFPGTNWEFTKWDKLDAIGFLACCASVGVILVLFKGLMMIGA